jgi:hypothetical protein
VPKILLLKRPSSRRSWAFSINCRQRNKAGSKAQKLGFVLSPEAAQAVCNSAREEQGSAPINGNRGNRNWTTVAGLSQSSSCGKGYDSNWKQQLAREKVFHAVKVIEK